MKRFWEQAALDPRPEGYAIRLDRTQLRLPGGAVLLVGPAPLAAAIAAEWQAAGGGKGGTMSFADTPLTRLAGTAQERIAPDPAPTIDGLARYAESDLLCYRSEAPEPLVRRQHAAWQPWLDWAAQSLDAPLLVGHGIAPLRQPREREGDVRCGDRMLHRPGPAGPRPGAPVAAQCRGGGLTGCRQQVCEGHGSAAWTTDDPWRRRDQPPPPKARQHALGDHLSGLRPER